MHDNKNENLENQEELSEQKEVLVVTSKLKNYIRSQSGMNTSSSVAAVLSEKVKTLCQQAIDSARHEGRKTVMDRDFHKSINE